MQKHTKLTVLATLGTVALGATLIGAAPALAAGNGNSYERGSLRAELSQTADVGSRACANYVDADGDGICSSRGSRNGAGFVDADGDGICDNYGSGTGGGHHSRHGGDHHGGGRGHC